MPQNIKAIVFDLDNTLFDFYEALLKAHELLFKRYNKEGLSLQDFMKEVNTQDRIYFQKYKSGCFPIKELAIHRTRAIYQAFGIEKDLEFCKKFAQELEQTLIEQISLHPQIEKILAQLSAKYPLYLLTNGTTSFQEGKIKSLELEKYFSEIFISGTIGYEKPDPRAFTHLLEKTNIQPSSTLVIGDDFHMDIEPSEKLGFYTLNYNVDELSTKELDFSKDLLEQFAPDIKSNI